MHYLRKSFSLALILLALVATVFGIRSYWQYSLRYPSTENAYIQANTIDISAEVSGRVLQVPIKNNGRVTRGQLLLAIDPRPYQYAVELAQANVTTARQTIAAQKQAIAVDLALIAKARAQLIAQEKNAKRIATLVKDGRSSLADGDTATAQLGAARAELNAAKKQYLLAKDTLGDTGDNNATVQAAISKLKQARYDLAQTKIVAPQTGLIANLTLRQGDFISVGKPVFSLIETQKWWVDANFKETEITRIKAGQTATITIDSYPGKIFHGVVDSLSPGTGSAFSLLPPENASGNWVKVTQRLPVKIKLTALAPKIPLHIGTSCTVKIDTTT